MRNTNSYSDIIDLPHHVSLVRPQMSTMDRAAQFSPFAALTGYDAAIRETGRLTDQRIEPDESVLAVLNMKFQILISRLLTHPEVSFTYFQPDMKKSGGKYVTVSGTVKKFLEEENTLILLDGTKIPVMDIIVMEGPLFLEAE